MVGEILITLATLAGVDQYMARRSGRVSIIGAAFKAVKSPHPDKKVRHSVSSLFLPLSDEQRKHLCENKEWTQAYDEFLGIIHDFDYSWILKRSYGGTLKNPMVLVWSDRIFGNYNSYDHVRAVREVLSAMNLGASVFMANHVPGQTRKDPIEDLKEWLEAFTQPEPGKKKVDSWFTERVVEIEKQECVILLSETKISDNLLEWQWSIVRTSRPNNIQHVVARSEEIKISVYKMTEKPMNQLIEFYLRTFEQLFAQLPVPKE